MDREILRESTINDLREKIKEVYSTIEPEKRSLFKLFKRKEGHNDVYYKHLQISTYRNTIAKLEEQHGEG